MARRQRYQRVLLPGEREGRRDFVKKGLVGALLLAAGGGAYLATRRTRPASGLGPLQVLTPEEATVVLAVANRLIPERVGFPRPLEVAVPRKVDAVVAGLHPGAQKDFRRLLNLFEGAVAGFVFEGQLRTFTACAPWEQDDRLRGWAHSRVTLRRSGARALKRLIHAAYYASPETWQAIGYPGPPPVPPPVPPERPPVPEGAEEEPAAARPPEPSGPARQAPQPKAAEARPRAAEARPKAPRPEDRPRAPEAPPPAEAAPARKPADVPLAPRPVEPVPAPGGGVPAPEGAEKP